VERPRRCIRAELVRRVFEIDVLERPRCRGRMKLIATLTQPEVVRAVLGCIGLPARASREEPPAWTFT
jgi:hypothetical protein